MQRTRSVFCRLRHRCVLLRTLCSKVKECDSVGQESGDSKKPGKDKEEVSASEKAGQTVQMAYRLYKSYPQPDELAHNDAPVLIMHGVLGNKENWRSVSTSVAEQSRRPVYALDARNHGQSPHVPEHTNVLMAADVLAFMKQHKISTICPMGYSMGARCMMVFTLKYPQLVERAIFVDTSPVRDSGYYKRVKELFDVLNSLSLKPNRTLAEGRYLALEELKLIIKNDRGARLILKNLRKHPKTGEFYWAANLKAVQGYWNSFKHFYETLEGFKPFPGPVLFVGGQAAHYDDGNDIIELRKFFPEVKVAYLLGHHWMNFGDLKAYRTMVLEFLNNRSEH